MRTTFVVLALASHASLLGLATPAAPVAAIALLLTTPAALVAGIKATS